jgi:hypothetical protein
MIFSKGKTVFKSQSKGESGSKSNPMAPTVTMAPCPKDLEWKWRGEKYNLVKRVSPLR